MMDNKGCDKNTIWVIGDSTVSCFADQYYYPRYGWGTQLANYFDDTYDICNIALSGRSSKSFTTELEYTTLLNGMKNGDWLLIGFGHNDEKTEAGRFTNPNGTYMEEGTFAYSIYENYIQPATKSGTKVVLCTPIVRRTATGVWDNANIHITSDVGAYAGGDYAQAIRKLGKDVDVTVVDMTAITKKMYETMGPEQTIYLHAWTSPKEASVDNTHTNIWGSKYNAYLITKTIRALGVIGLAEHIVEVEPPVKEKELIANPEYKVVEYSNMLSNSELWNPVGIWKGTVFGDVGGEPSKDDFKLACDFDGNINISVENNKGKIAESVDGMAMYYYRIPTSSTFTLTATAKINRIFLNDQVSFGLMARDDMYIDANIIDVIGDYVATGPLKITQTGQVWNCLARKSGTLIKGNVCNRNYSEGDTVELKLESTSDGYACTFGEEATVTGGFDFKLTAIDSDYVYVGMFVARNADITFSHITLVIDGKEITE